MIFTIIGVNTGIIRQNDKFAALALKIKHPKNKQSLLFFPLVGRDAYLVVVVNCQIPADNLIVHFF